MMGYDKVAVALYGFFHRTFGHIKRQEHSRTVLCRIACLQSCVVVVFLQSARGKFLNRV